MSTASLPSVQRAHARRRRSTWLDAKTMWAGLAIISMWLAVLFVGIFGGDFVSSGAATTTTIPLAVFLLPFVLPGTLAIGRRAFTDRQPIDELRAALDDEAQARAQFARELADLRSKLS